MHDDIIVIAVNILRIQNYIFTFFYFNNYNC